MAMSKGTRQEELSIQSCHDPTPCLGSWLIRPHSASTIGQKETFPGRNDTANITESPYSSIKDSSEQQRSALSEKFPDGSTLAARGLLLRKTRTLKYFDNDITGKTQARFNDLKELFEKPLYDYVLKSKLRFTAISMRLQVLGESEETAKPWIVIQCDRKVSSRVKQFFKEPHIKQLYQAHDAECDFPTFEILVHDKPLRLLGKPAVYFQRFYNVVLQPARDPSSTWCGRAIMCGTLVGTLGGIIKVEWPGSRVAFYGMTAGHIANSADEEEKPLDPPVKDVGTSTTNDDEDDQVLFQLDDKLETGSKYKVLASYWRTNWKMMGNLLCSTADNIGDGQNLDWALVEFLDPAMQLPNKTPLGENGENSEYVSKVWRPAKDFGKDDDQPTTKKVFILRSQQYQFVEASIFLELSMTPSFLLLYPGTKLTTVYILKGMKASDTSLRGICGSWVVDRDTLEVYGYIVAIDMFCDVFVVPFSSALDDIKKRLGASKVSLPSPRDFGRGLERLAVYDWDAQRHIPPNLEHGFHDSAYSSTTYYSVEQDVHEHKEP